MPDQEITLIEVEALEALERERAIRVEPNETRRNIITRNVPLNHLVGREFTVGEVRVRGHRLCEPCSFLESKTRKGVCAGLIHRGGLRAEIIGTGVIRVGDAVATEQPAEALA
jgi:MOSC domain-containing protein YiiM